MNPRDRNDLRLLAAAILGVAGAAIAFVGATMVSLPTVIVSAVTLAFGWLVLVTAEEKLTVNQPARLRKTQDVQNVPADELGKHLLLLFFLHPAVHEEFFQWGETLDEVGLRLNEADHASKEQLLACVERFLGIPQEVIETLDYCDAEEDVKPNAALLRATERFNALAADSPILAEIRQEREARTDEEKAAEDAEDERRVAEAIKNYPPAYQRSLYADRREFKAASGQEN